MDVTSLYTNIPQAEGTQIVCKAYNKHRNNPPVPTEFLREIRLQKIFEINLKNFNKASNFNWIKYI